MAELVCPPRTPREHEETAVAVRGALVRPQRGPGGQLLEPNQNHLKVSRKSKELTDEQIKDFLEASGRVNLKELCTYITPDVINHQDEKIAPIIDAILYIINCMAKTRRTLLYYRILKIGSPAEIQKMENDLVFWPVQVQEMQGRIEAMNGRILRIPYDLVLKLVLD